MSHPVNSRIVIIFYSRARGSLSAAILQHHNTEDIHLKVPVEIGRPFLVCSAGDADYLRARLRCGLCVCLLSGSEVVTGIGILWEIE